MPIKTKSSVIKNQALFPIYPKMICCTLYIQVTVFVRLFMNTRTYSTASVISQTPRAKLSHLLGGFSNLFWLDAAFSPWGYDQESVSQSLWGLVVSVWNPVKIFSNIIFFSGLVMSHGVAKLNVRCLKLNTILGNIVRTNGHVI